MRVVQVSYETTQHAKAFAVHTNFPIVGDDVADYRDLVSIEGVEQAVIAMRYQLIVQVGKHFNWSTIWPQVEKVMRWHGQEHLDKEAIEADVERVRQATENPRPKLTAAEAERLQRIYADNLAASPLMTPRSISFKRGGSMREILSEYANSEERLDRIARLERGKRKGVDDDE